jgi:predicted  nucleic acid-binding Zn-ribbon protein
MKMLNRSTLADALPAPTPAAIAAGVRRHAELQAGELQLSRLSNRIGELRDQQRSVIAAHHGDLDGTDFGREVNRLAKEAEALEQQAHALRAQLAPARRTHAERVAAALRPQHQDAARRVVRAIAQIREAVAEMNEIGMAAGEAGGDLGDWTPMLGFGGTAWLGAMEAEARRKLAESSA